MSRRFRLSDVLFGIFVLLFLISTRGSSIRAQAEPIMPAAVATIPLPADVDSLRRERGLLEEQGAALPDVLRPFDNTQKEEEWLAVLSEIAEIRTRIEEYRSTGNASRESLSDLLADATALDENLQRIRDSVSSILAELEERSRSWQDRRSHYRAWRNVFSRHSMEKEAIVELKALGVLVDRAADQISKATRPYLDLQQRMITEQTDLRQLIYSLNEIRRNERQDMVRRREALFSGETIQSLMTTRWTINGEDLKRAVTPRRGSWRVWTSEEGWLLALLPLIMLLLVWMLYLLKRFNQNIPALPLFLQRWFSTAILLVGFIFLPFLRNGPPLLVFLLWFLVTIALLRLRRQYTLRAIPRSLLRWTVFVFLALYAARLLHTPGIWLRLAVLLVALAAVPYLFSLRARSRTADNRPGSGVLPWLGLLVCLLVIVTDIIGFSTLAMKAFDIFVNSVLLLMTAGTVFTLLQAMPRQLPEYLPGSSHDRIKQHGGEIARRIFGFLRFLVVILVGIWLLQVWGIFPTLGHGFKALAGYGLPLGDTRITLGNLFTALILLYAAFSASHILQAFLAYDYYPYRNIEEGIGVSINRLVHYGFVLLGFLFFISALGFDMQNLAILGGALGIGIGFGLQNIISNFVSGLILLVERPVKVGDVVVLGDTWGRILTLGLRATIVETFDRSEIIIPNSDLITNQVTNWTRKDRISRMKIPVGVAYGSDTTQVIRILSEAAQALPEVLTDPPPKILFTGFGDSSLDFEVWIWLADLGQRLDVRTALLQDIDTRFRAVGIEIPFPQRDLHIRSMPDRDLPSA